MTFVLRDYQQQALDDLRRAWVELRHEGKVAPRLLLVSRTGSGKTVIAGEFLRGVLGKGKRALFIVRDRVLLNQTSRHLDRVGITNHAVLAAGHPRRDPAAPVQVCSAQTIVAREARPPADVLVFDEAHGIMCATSRAIADQYPDATILGLTATPVRGDGKPLGEPYGVFQRLIQVRATFDQLVQQGALVDCIVIAPFGKEMKTLADKPIEALRRYGVGRRVVMFGRNRAHAAELAEEARAAGFRAGTVHGESDDREEMLERITLPADDPRAFDVLTNCDLLKQGWDAPECDTIILARGCSSFTQYMQICGRALRPIPPHRQHLFTKPHALIVDLRGSVNKHGHPADDVEFALDGKAIRRPKDKQQPLRQCPKCGAVFRMRQDCPNCGFIFVSRGGAKVVVTPLSVIKPRRQMSPEELQAFDLARRKSFFDDLCVRVRGLGWKPGAVGFRYQAKWGEWPPWPLPRVW